MAEVSSAFVSLIPTMKKSDVNKALAGAGIAPASALAGGTAADKFGTSFSGRVKGALGKTMKGGLMAVGAVGATALAKGFGRLKSLEQAEAKLTGLGHSAKSVDKIMDNALTAVKGTAFGMDEAATTAAGAVAAGIKPGKDLESVLTLVGDAATIGGTSMSEMGGIFNKVASSNKVQGDVINQLNERGIPIVQLLGKELGKTSEEVYEMSRKGEIDFKTFRAAMESGLGGAAQESGKTFTGALANAGAALGRLGASALQGVFPKMRVGLGTITAALDSLGPAAEGAGATVGKGLTVAADAATGLYNVLVKGDFTGGIFGVEEDSSLVDYLFRTRDAVISAFGSIREQVGKAVEFIKPHLKTFGNDMVGVLPYIKSLASAIGSFLVAAFRAAVPYLKIAAGVIGGVLVGALKILPPILKGVLKAFEWTLNILKPFLPLIVGIAAAWGAYRLVMLGVTAAQFLATKATAAYNLVVRAGQAVMAAKQAVTYSAAAAQRFYAMSVNGGTGAVKARTLAEKAGLIVGKAKVAVTNAMTVAQKALNIALVNNPIGRVIALLALLVGGVILAYKHHEGFRNLVNKVWASIKKAAASVVGWFKNTAWPNLRDVFSAIGKAAMSLWTGAIRPAFNAIAKIAKWLYQNVIKRYFALITKVITAVGKVVTWLSKVAFAVAILAIAAVVKWLWGRLKANFALIRAGLRKVGDAAKWLYKKAIDPTFKAISKVATWLWGKLRAAFDKIKGIAKTTGSAIKSTLWTNSVKPVFKWMSDRASWLWGKFKDAFAKIRGIAKTTGSAIKSTLWTKGAKPVFKWVADRAGWLWGKVRDSFDKIKDGARKVKDTFVTVRKGIKKTWDKMYGNIKSPIVKAINWLNDKFVKRINKMLGNTPGVPKSFRIDEISTKGFARGGYTGAGSKYAPAGIVHKDEFVLKKEATNRLRKQIGLDGLNYMNQTGRMPVGGYSSGGMVDLPGYKIGGKVAGLNKRFLQQLHDFNKAAGGRYRVNSGYRSNAHQRVLYNLYKSGRGPVAAKPGSSMHNRGLAADLAPSDARRRHSNAYVKKFGLQYTVPSEDWHIEPIWARAAGAAAGAAGKGGGGGGIRLPAWVRDPVGTMKSKFEGWTKNYTGKSHGLAGGVLPAIFTNLRKAVTEKIKDAANIFDSGGGPGMDISGIAKGPAKGQVKAVAKNYGWHKGANWAALDYIISKESSWNPKAANPSSSARGLFQKMTTIHGAIEKTAAGQAKWGLNYIKGRYGNPVKARNFWAMNNWYADGGMVDAPTPLLFDSGGYLPEGLSLVQNNTGAPEPLMRMNGGGGMTFNLIDADGVLIGTMRGVAADEAAFASTIGRQRR